jgi:hypothetical protein
LRITTPFTITKTMTRHLLTAALLLTAAPGLIADEAKPAAPAADAKAAPIKAGEYTFHAAAPWAVRAEPKMMSAGGATIAGKDGKPGVEADFYHFGAGGGGGDEANIARWVNQFQPGEDGKPIEPKREDLTFGDKKVILVQLKGTFLAGGAMAQKKTPMPGYAMMGAIIPGEGGSVYLKVTGPEAAVTAAAEDVKKLIGSAFAAK